MNPVISRWEQIRDALQNEVAGQTQVACLIPGWEPVDLEMGLRWLRSTVFEGFSVAYRITNRDEDVVIWFKRWEYGEPEPAWSDSFG